MSPTIILHLEDSVLDADLVRSRLSKAGLKLEIARVDGRDDFAAALDSRRFDLILADYALPGFDGLAALEIARSTAPQTPFLFVSGVSARRSPSRPSGTGRPTTSSSTGSSGSPRRSSGPWTRPASGPSAGGPRPPSATATGCTG